MKGEGGLHLIRHNCYYPYLSVFFIHEQETLVLLKYCHCSYDWDVARTFLSFAVFLLAELKLKVSLHMSCPSLLIRPVRGEMTKGR